MSQLSAQQQSWWDKLVKIMNDNDYSINKLRDVEKAMRELALLIIQDNYRKNKPSIIVSGHAVHGFKSNAEFNRYLQKNSRDGEWAEDTLLFATLDSLGYQIFMDLPGTHVPTYMPNQQQEDTGLSIHVLNHGAVTGGFHWTIAGQDNPGGGNCGIYTMAQAVMRDMPVEQKVQIENTSVVKQLKTQVVAPQTEMTVAECEKQFKKLEDAHKARRDEVRKEIKARLNNSSMTVFQQINTLKVVYKDLEALEGKSGDVFLKTYPVHSDNPFVGLYLTAGQLPAEQADLNQLKQDLIHAISTEAWRSEQAYQYLMKQYGSNNTKINKPSVIDLSDQNQQTIRVK